VAGITGLAHMFEHMAFKGTDVIGTTDHAAEKAALEKVEAAYDAWDRERRSRTGRDEKRLAELEKAWKDAIAEADRYVVRNAFRRDHRPRGRRRAECVHEQRRDRLLLLHAGQPPRAVGLPGVRALPEAGDARVLQGARRRDGGAPMRTDSQPIGRLIEQFLAAAFTAHPYGQPGVGWPSDLQSFSATDAAAFYGATTCRRT